MINKRIDKSETYHAGLFAASSGRRAFARAFKRSTFPALVCAVLFGSGCSDGSSPDPEYVETCSVNEVLTVEGCACDSSNRYYGTPGNCQICDATGKIIRDNACVCDGVNFEDDGNGGCKSKSISPCGLYERQTATGCVCDDTKNYYGTTGNCTKCEGTGKIVKNNQCVCNDTSYEDDGNGGCKVRSTPQECGEHEIESDNGCVCDEANMYYGEAGNCQKCEGDDVVLKNHACVCDEAHMYYGEAGSCQKCEGAGRTVINNQCVCDKTSIESNGECICYNEAGYYGESGHCMPCFYSGATVVDNTCVCNEAHKYYGESAENCEYCHGNGAIVKEHACVCDEDNLFFGMAPNCWHCGDDEKTVIENNVCVCNEEYGYYGNADNCQICSGFGYNEIIKDHACICDEEHGFYATSSGCEYCNPERGNIENHQCVCDESKNYYNTEDGCYYCDPQHSTIRDHECVCDETKNSYIINGFCRYCGYEGNVYKNGQCLCDTANGYAGIVNFRPNDCQKCDGEGTIVGGYGCVCDASKGYYGEAGSCNKCGEGAIYTGKCVCDMANGYYGDAGSCKKCAIGEGETLLETTCVCDDYHGYYGEVGNCQKCEGNGRVVSSNQCVCASGRNWQEDPENPGSCICKDGYVNMKDGVVDPTLSGDCVPIMECPGNMVLQENTNTCVCDIEHNWQGIAPNCKCDWESGDYIQQGAYVCLLKAKCDPVKETLIEKTNTCVCNEKGNWQGTPGECTCGGGDDSYVIAVRDGKTLCEPIAICREEDHTVLDAETNTCVCDADNGWESMYGTCLCPDKLTNDNGKCVCDIGAGYISDESGNCVCEDKRALDNGSYCKCDYDNNWVPESWRMTNGRKHRCVCDTGYVRSGDNCVACDGIVVAGTNCISKVGDIVTFGSYLQWNEETPEPLQWRVLSIDKENHKSLIISEYVIDGKKYNDKFVETTWASSTIRAWLNDSFMNETFTDEERDLILKTHVETPSEYGYEREFPGGEATEDYIFLLSMDEARSYFSNNSDRTARPTNHTINSGAYAQYYKPGYNYLTCTIETNTPENECVSPWWLRSPQTKSYHCAVSRTGDPMLSSGEVTKTMGVRPAMWVREF